MCKYRPSGNPLCGHVCGCPRAGAERGPVSHELPFPQSHSVSFSSRHCGLSLKPRSDCQNISERACIRYVPAFRRWEPRGVVPAGGPKAGGPTFRAFFSFSRSHFRFFFSPSLVFSCLFSLSRGLIVEFWCCLKRWDPKMCTFGVLGLSCPAAPKAAGVDQRHSALATCLADFIHTLKSISQASHE